MLTWMLVAPLAAAGDYQRLHPDLSDATSYLRSNWNRFTENYHPNYVLDDNAKTAWVEGEEGNGEGSTLSMPVSYLPQVDRVKLRIRNGYQKSRGLLTANAAPREVSVTLVDAAGPVTTHTAALERTMGWQEIEVAVPSGRGLMRVELTVVSVHPGRRYRDTCISDVQVLVDAPVPYNASQEQALQAKVSDWIRTRVAKARYFASQPADYPFAATAFEAADSRGISEAEYTKVAAPLLARAEAMAADRLVYRATPKATLPNWPDGAPLPAEDLVEPYLIPGNVSFFETDRPVASQASDGDREDGWFVETTVSNVRLVKRSDSANPEWVYLWSREEEEGRVSTVLKTHFLAQLDADGRIETLLVDGRGSLEGTKLAFGVTSVVRFQRDEQGRIAGYEQWDAERGPGKYWYSRRVPRS